MSETTTNNNQVRFLTGTQSKLNNLNESQVGAFYLTNDTNRLYVGTGNGKPALVNKVVEVVDSLDKLPTFTSDADKQAHLNDFYYVKDKNILCVYTNTDTSAPWTQINPDTDTDTNVRVTSVTVKEAPENEQESGKIKYKIVLGQTKFDTMDAEGSQGTSLADITATFTIDGKSLASIVPEAAAVELDVESNKNEETNIDEITIKTDGAGAALTNNSVVIVGDGKTAKVGLNDKQQVQISAAEYDLTGNIDKEKDEIKLYLSHDMEDKVDGVTPEPDVTIDLTYLKDYADSKFAAVGNPLHYKGTIGSLAALNALTGVVDGDMYKANPSAAQTVATTEPEDGITEPGDGTTNMPFEAGDVFIYHDGAWERIPSGDDLVDTLYRGKMVADNANKIVFGIQEQGVAEGSIETVGDNLELNIGDKLSYNPTTKTLNHKKVNETGGVVTTPSENPASANDGFTVYTPTLDDYGHITAVAAQSYTVTDNDTTYSLTNNDTTKTFTLKGSDNAEGVHDGSITLTEAANSSIAITSTTSNNAATYSFDLVWGTF